MEAFLHYFGRMTNVLGIIGQLWGLVGRITQANKSPHLWFRKRAPVSVTHGDILTFLVGVFNIIYSGSFLCQTLSSHQCPAASELLVVDLMKFQHQATLCALVLPVLRVTQCINSLRFFLCIPFRGSLAFPLCLVCSPSGHGLKTFTVLLIHLLDFTSHPRLPDLIRLHVIWWFFAQFWLLFTV